MTIPAARYSNNPISAVSKSRALVIARARAPLSVPDKIRLAVKVAHAVTDSANVNTNTNPTYRQFVEGFKCGIIPGKMFSVASLTAHLLADARAIQVPTDNWHEAVFPPGDGKWGLAVNELTRARPGPQMVKTWDQEMTIQGIIDLQDYCLGKTATAYPITLIWYTKTVALEGVEGTPPLVPTPPPLDHITIPDSDSLPSLGTIFGVPKHKRTISEAIPDRDKGRQFRTYDEGPVLQALLQDDIKKEDDVKKEDDDKKEGDDKAERGNTQVDDKAARGKTLTGDGQRRSGRARKATAKVIGTK